MPPNSNTFEKEEYDIDFLTSIFEIGLHNLCKKNYFSCNNRPLGSIINIFADMFSLLYIWIIQGSESLPNVRDTHKFAAHRYSTSPIYHIHIDHIYEENIGL